MVTRRSVLRSFAALGAGALAPRVAVAGAYAATGAGQRSSFLEGACNCHAHIIGDYDRYPMVGSRVYTPPTATIDAFKAMQRTLGIGHAVLIQPSFYGTDNSCLLAALQTLGGAARGVAVVPAGATPVQLDALHRAEIVGIRVNQTGGSRDLSVLKEAIDRTGREAAELGWHVQLFLPMQTLAALAPTIQASPATFVFDHFAGAKNAGPGQEGFESVTGLMKSGKAYVKLSAPYHIAKSPDYAGIGELAAAFVAANSDRILWGTDWPHTDSRKVPGRSAEDISPFYPVSDVDLVEKFFEWVPDGPTQRKILVDNPRAVFRFE